MGIVSTAVVVVVLTAGVAVRWASGDGQTKINNSIEPTIIMQPIANFIAAVGQSLSGLLAFGYDYGGSLSGQPGTFSVL